MTQTFINPNMPANLVLAQEEDGDVATIENLEIPILETLQTAFLVQSGHAHGEREKTLEGQEGKFFITGAQGQPGLEELADVLYALPIQVVSKTRKLKDSSGEEIICKSKQGAEIPADDIVSPFADKCGEYQTRKDGSLAFKPECEKSKFSEGGEAPECQETITAAFIDVERLIPFTMSFYRTSLSAWNALQKKYKAQKDLIRINKMRKKTEKDETIQDYVFKFTSQEVKTKKNKYYKMSIDFVEGSEIVGFKPNKLNPLCLEYYNRFFSPEKWQEQTKEEEPATQQEAAVTPDMEAAADSQDFNI